MSNLEHDAPAVQPDDPIDLLAGVFLAGFARGLLGPSASSLTVRASGWGGDGEARVVAEGPPELVRRFRAAVDCMEG